MKFETLLRVRMMSDAELAEVALHLAEAHPETFETLLVDRRTNVFTIPGTNNTVRFSNQELNAVRAECRADQKVAAIKLVRAATGIGLKEAKDLVEYEFWGRE